MHKHKIGVYIGRFQPFHNGHLETVKVMLNECERIIISVGSHNRPKTIKNPWSSEERIEIIKKTLIEEYNPDLKKEWTDFPEKTILERVTFQSVRDYMYNDTKWSAELTSKALANGATYNKEETVLYGHFKDDSSYYLNSFPHWGLRTVKNFYNIDATQVRDELFKFKNLSDETEKRLSHSTKWGVKAWIHSGEGSELKAEYDYYQDYQKPYAHLPFKPVFITVDNVVIKSGHILLIKRKALPGKGLWALPGGFLDPNETVLKAAIRELKEETRIKVDKPVLERSVKDIQVFDHPKRSMRGRTVTHAHLVDLGIGPLPHVKGSDDAEHARWFPLADFHQMERQLFEDHYDIIFNMTSKY